MDARDPAASIAAVRASTTAEIARENAGGDETSTRTRLRVAGIAVLRGATIPPSRWAAWRACGESDRPYADGRGRARVDDGQRVVHRRHA